MMWSWITNHQVQRSKWRSDVYIDKVNWSSSTMIANPQLRSAGVAKVKLNFFWSSGHP